MREIESKCIEIAFDKESPQMLKTKIKIMADVQGTDDLEYKFLIGKDGIWNSIQDFSKKNYCIWRPEYECKYMIMVQARSKNSTKPILAITEYSIIKVTDMNNCMDNEFTNIKLLNKNNEVPNKERVKENHNFKDVTDENILLLDPGKVTLAEKKELISDINDVKDEIAVSSTAEKSQNDINEKTHVDEEETDSSDNKIIDKIVVDKKEIKVGDKCFIRVETFKNIPYLYRFYTKVNDEWKLVRDYHVEKSLKYTATTPGKKEFLIQCKRMNSTESVDDFTVMSIDVGDVDRIEISNIKCLTKELIAGNKLEFVVDTKVGNKRDDEKGIILYKFYRIDLDGRSTCIQDYSTSNMVSYIEDECGKFRILCLVKGILSVNQYDDRAVMIYNVKPYKDIKINSFVASLNSPQATETNITFTSEIEGGSELLYRYAVRGPIEQDTGFNKESEFLWNPAEPGEYEIYLFVKNYNSKKDYDDMKKIAFTIEKRGKKPIKILDVVVDKGNRVIIGDTVNIMVKAEGGTHLLYSFIVRNGDKIVENQKFNKSNWIDFVPTECCDYTIELLIKDKYSEKKYDVSTVLTVKSMKYLPGEIDYILLPYKEMYLVGDVIEMECIIQNTSNILVKYETKINGNSVEQTEYSKNKKLRFVPKISGKYTIEIYAKNIKCEKEYDSKKQINIYVSEASPVINTKVTSEKQEAVVNEEFTVQVTSSGGKDVCYEFYLMESNEWKKVQSYSKKNYYSFIPFKAGKGKILALAKSYYKKVNYEDYDVLTFEIKD